MPPSQLIFIARMRIVSDREYWGERVKDAHRLSSDVTGAVGHQERNQVRDVLGRPGALEDTAHPTLQSRGVGVRWGQTEETYGVPWFRSALE